MASLLAPVPFAKVTIASPDAPRPSAVAPITRKDQVRASYWGLRLPPVPIAVEPPAPVEPIGDAGDSRDTWTDESRWTVTEDAADVAEPSAPATMTDTEFKAWKISQADALAARTVTD